MERSGGNVMRPNSVVFENREKVHPCIRLPRFWSTLLSGAALAAAVAGCAGPSARMASVNHGTVSTAQAPTDLSGTWRGSFSRVNASIYADDADCVLRIRDDGTFTQQITPQPGANNRAKASTSTGTVVEKGNRVVLRTSKGEALTLERSGDQLYGVTSDPEVEAPVSISLQRSANG
jgi:hypothetical protein